MSTLLVKNATVLVTMDTERREIAGGGLFARDGWIEQVGPPEELPDTADEVIDLDGHVALPGFVNTHHQRVSRDGLLMLIIINFEKSGCI